MIPWATRFILFLAGIALLLACNVSTTDHPDTLTFRLPDSLKASEGKYDTVRLDLYSVSAKDTIFLETLFIGLYDNPDQLEKLPLPSGLDGGFLIRVVAYKEGRKRLDLGVPFEKGRQSGKNVVYPLPPIDSIPLNRPPSFTSGLQDRSIMEGEVVTITVKARDEDGDALNIVVLNLDSLRGLFQNRPEAVKTFADADSLVLRFDPGYAPGNYRFRLSVADSTGAGEAQALTVSVGKVNRPPRLAFLSPEPTSSFRILEGQTLILHITAEDPDSSDAIRLLPLDQPPWPRCGSGAYDTIAGTLTFTPAYACVGHGETTFANLFFRAVDNGNPPETGEIAASITVVDVNTAPKWGPGPVPLQGKEGRNLTLDLADLFSGDAEGDSVTFSASCGSVLSDPLRWTFTPGFRDSGQMSCALTATDSHQPPASSQLDLELSIEDSTRALDVAILSPARGAVFRDTLIRVSWQVGSVHQPTDTTERLKSEGPNLIRRSLVDSLGNEGFDTLTVYLDTKPPLKPKVRGPGWTNQRRPRWTWQGGGGGNGNFRLRLDTLDFGPGTIAVQDTAYTAEWPLSEGRHVLYVQERDAAGNWSAADSAVARVDVTPPVVSIQSPADGHVTNQENVAVHWTADGVAQPSFSQTLEEGSNTISRSVTDSAGNEGRASITVTRRSQVVFVNAAAPEGGDGNSWATAAKTLQSGLAKALNGWEIWVAKGIYMPSTGSSKFDTSFVMKPGITLLGGFSGSENDTAERDWQSNSTIISGEPEVGGQTGFRSMPLVRGSEHGRLDGFILENGRSYLGAALNVEFDRMSVANCIFRKNTGYSESGGGSIMVTGTYFSISNSEFIENSNTGEAGAVCIMGQSAAISNTKFMGNRANRSGGALYIDIDASILITNSIFFSNVTTSSVGGAIGHSGSVEIRNSFFLNNSAGYSGGAIYSHLGYITLLNCVFAENATDGDGGAIGIFFANTKGTNLTFFNNSAKGNGGALFYEGNTSQASTVRIQNSIFWANKAVSAGPQIALSLTLPNSDNFLLQYSILEGGILDVLKPDAANWTIGPEVTVVSPQFRNPNSLAGQDGIYMTEDDGLSPAGGPAINAGILSGSPTMDITGSIRPKGGFIDLGAYEP